MQLMIYSNPINMDFKEIMKFQVMSQIGSQNLNHNTKSSDGGLNLIPIICQFFLMACIGLFEELIKAIPKLLSDFQKQFINKFRENVEKAIEPKQKFVSDIAVPLSKRHFLNSMSMMRTYCNTDVNSKSIGKGSSDESNIMVDAVLEQISRLDNVPSFQLIDKAQVMISYKDTPIQVTHDIFAKIEDIVYAGEQLASIKLTLLSNTISAAEISLYVKGLYAAYIETMKNSLGANIYFFDQKERDGNSQPQMAPIDVTPASVSNQKRMRISTASKQLTFTMTQFHSNKQFSNIYGKQIREIEQRVRFFIDNKAWYDSKGIPYQLGLLLSGLPGSGKTSAIRAIANLTKRHIINVNFANITTATQLKNLFYCEKLQVYTDSSLANTNSYFIPIEQRLYVLEEIDAIGDILKQRSSDVDDTKTEPTLHDELTLMEILTVLDGTMEIPGRILIMTSNHPEVLDKALIRPGRIDLKVNFSYATRELIVEMYEAYMDKTFDKSNIDKLPDGLLSPAEVGQVLFRHFGSEHTEAEIIEDFVESGYSYRGLEKPNQFFSQEIMEENPFKYTETDIIQDRKYLDVEEIKEDESKTLEPSWMKVHSKVYTEKKKIDNTYESSCNNNWIEGINKKRSESMTETCDMNIRPSNAFDGYATF